MPGMHCIHFDESDTLTTTEAMMRGCGRILQVCPDFTRISESFSASKSASNASLNESFPPSWRVMAE